ncbi:hypothetical protein HK405_011480 [Cladochytrium tenue]|nr:hypothetical protein HK405_011480 [Cladochytrium tenue]
MDAHPPPPPSGTAGVASAAGAGSAASAQQVLHAVELLQAQLAAVVASANAGGADPDSVAAVLAGIRAQLLQPPPAAATTTAADPAEPTAPAPAIADVLAAYSQAPQSPASGPSSPIPAAALPVNPAAVSSALRHSIASIDDLIRDLRTAVSLSNNARSPSPRVSTALPPRTPQPQPATTPPAASAPLPPPTQPLPPVPAAAAEVSYSSPSAQWTRSKSSVGAALGPKTPTQAGKPSLDALLAQLAAASGASAVPPESSRDTLTTHLSGKSSLSMSSSRGEESAYTLERLMLEDNVQWGYMDRLLQNTGTQSIGSSSSIDGPSKGSRWVSHIAVLDRTHLSLFLFISPASTPNDPPVAILRDIGLLPSHNIRVTDDLIIITTTSAEWSLRGVSMRGMGNVDFDEPAKRWSNALMECFFEGRARYKRSMSASAAVAAADTAFPPVASGPTLTSHAAAALTHSYGNQAYPATAGPASALSSNTGSDLPSSASFSHQVRRQRSQTDPPLGGSALSSVSYGSNNTGSGLSLQQQMQLLQQQSAQQEQAAMLQQMIQQQQLQQQQQQLLLSQGVNLPLSATRNHSLMQSAMDSASSLNNQIAMQQRQLLLLQQQQQQQQLQQLRQQQQQQQQFGFSPQQAYQSNGAIPQLQLATAPYPPVGYANAPGGGGGGVFGGHPGGYATSPASPHAASPTSSGHGSGGGGGGGVSGFFSGIVGGGGGAKSKRGDTMNSPSSGGSPMAKSTSGGASAKKTDHVRKLENLGFL